MENSVVVPDTSFATASSGAPVGDDSAAMNASPSGPRSPACDSTDSGSSASSTETEKSRLLTYLARHIQAAEVRRARDRGE